MVIQHNMSALNVNRMLGLNNRRLAGSTEKMASGYKINRAADDAAGLSISEKMRKRIRGLERGMENVQDGISFCQVADGALDTATDLLQRVRELSIQAYNGTNSKSDRHTIQKEIDECFVELDRVFETTKFNETVIFKNGQRVQGATFHSQEYIRKGTTTTYRNMPDWLEINDGQDSRIQLHSGYLAGQTQDTTGIMKQDFFDGDIKVYFGPDKGMQDGYKWVGRISTAERARLNTVPGFADYMNNHSTSGSYEGWTSDLNDNVSAKLDFSKYAEIKDSSELYSKLTQLVGAEIGFPCGSCYQMEAIRFGGSFNGVDGVTFQDGHPSYVTKGEINLSTKQFTYDGKSYTGYFDAIKALMESEMDEDGNLVAKNEAATKALAEAIAKDLTKATYSSLSNAMTRHFDRAMMVNGEDYSIYIYDYRDSDAIALSNSTADSTIRTVGKVTMNYEELVTTGYYTSFDYWNAEQTWVQASDGTMDGMAVLSKRLSTELLKLKDYRIDTYATDIQMDDPDGYRKELAAWNAAAPTPVYTPYETTEKVQVLVKPAEWKYWTTTEAGETKQHSQLVSPAEWKTEERKVTKYHVSYPNDTRGPRPVATYTVHERYNPSDVKLIDNALAAVNATRSYYGAVQNRLEHTYKNNYNADENMTYAESRIRDTDMAEETVRKSMLDILTQAGFSMLSQANQSRQGVSMLLS